MPDISKSNDPTQALPVVKSERTDSPLYHDIINRSMPKKTLADLGLERVTFTFLDAEGNLKSLTPIIGHDALNNVLTILEDAEIG